MMASIMVVFRFDLTMEFRILYPLFIPMIWIAVRYSFEGGAISVLAMPLALAAASGLGFRDDEMVTQLQFAMLAFTITAALVGVVVSERRVKSQKLRAKEQKLRWLFEMAPVGLVEVDPRLRIEAVNPTAAEMIGLPIPDALGRSLTEFTETFPPPEGRSDLRIHGLTGIRWSEVATSSTDDNDGGQTTIIALRDISERRDIELRRQIRRSEIQCVDRLNAAGELASAMAHELNQPLASIVYYSRASQRLLSFDPAFNPAKSESADSLPEGGADGSPTSRRCGERAHQASEEVANDAPPPSNSHRAIWSGGAGRPNR